MTPEINIMPEKKGARGKTTKAPSTARKPREDRPLGLRVPPPLAAALDKLAAPSPLSAHAVALAALYHGVMAMLDDPDLLERAHYAMLAMKKSGEVKPKEE
jgi:hypothetical protein